MGLLAEHLELIELDGEQVVFKRGPHELLVSGPAAAELAPGVLERLDGSRSLEEIVAEFPNDQRDDVLELLQALAARRLVGEPDGDRSADARQAEFYWHFGVAPGERLALARVLLVGANDLTAELARALGQLHVEAVRVVGAPALDTAPGAPPPVSAEDVAWATAVCAASETGAVEALVDVNRMALAAGVPFLPLWLDGMVSYTGPLNHPFETACLRCLLLRLDANDPRFETTRAIRARPGAAPAAVLPPMLAVPAQIAAIKLANLIVGFAPGDVAGRLIEISLVSFRSDVRRVLKVPRCPECGEPSRRAAPSLTQGPQIAEPA